MSVVLSGKGELLWFTDSEAFNAAAEGGLTYLDFENPVVSTGDYMERNSPWKVTPEVTLVSAFHAIYLISSSQSTWGINHGTGQIVSFDGLSGGSIKVPNSTAFSLELMSGVTNRQFQAYINLSGEADVYFSDAMIPEYRTSAKAFLGVVSTDPNIVINGLTIVGNDISDNYYQARFDNLQYKAIPEPNAVVLMISSFSGYWFWRRRRWQSFVAAAYRK